MTGSDWLGALRRVRKNEKMLRPRLATGALSGNMPISNQDPRTGEIAGNLGICQDFPMKSFKGCPVKCSE